MGVISSCAQPHALTPSMMDEKALKNLLESDDPLSEEAVSLLLDYREEDSHVDYKESFDHKQEKDWLEITKDVMAFANTEGGYLVFGVRDGSWEVIGLDTEVARFLSDATEIAKKVNRHVDPAMTGLRSKLVQPQSKLIVILFMPPSIPRTHVISKDGRFSFPSGKEKLVLRKGTLYVRRSGGNHLVDSRDLDDLISRRIEHFRRSLMDKIARVVEAPRESEVFVVSADPTTEPHKRFVIDNAPDSIPVKGLSFTVTPETPEQQVAAWIALSSGNRVAMPPRKSLWGWYEKRGALTLSQDQRIGLAEFCVLCDVPAFYWLRGCPAQVIKEMLLDAIVRRPSGIQCAYMLAMASFLGKRFYRSAIEALGDYASKLAPRMKKYPVGGPRSHCGGSLIESLRKGKAEAGQEEFRKWIEDSLDSIVAGVAARDLEQPSSKDREEAQAYDCFLYAQDDQYVKAGSPTD